MKLETFEEALNRSLKKRGILARCEWAEYGGKKVIIKLTGLKGLDYPHGEIEAIEFARKMAYDNIAYPIDLVSVDFHRMEALSAETFEARTYRKSQDRSNRFVKRPDGKHNPGHLRGYDRSPRGTPDSKLDIHSMDRANTRVKANIQGKEDLTESMKFEASQRKCGACGETGHNARTCKSKLVPFSTGGYWNEFDWDFTKPLKERKEIGQVKKGLPLVDGSHVAMISKIVDGEVLKEPNAGVRMPNITWKEEPIKMTWGELDEKCKEGDLVSIGESTYSGAYLRGALAYLPKNTVLTLYTGVHYPLKATFEYGGEEWIFFLAPRVENYYAETFDVEFNDWANQEMMSHGKNISFKDWAKDEGMKHGNTELTDWAQHEDESHDARYGSESLDMKKAQGSNMEYECQVCGKPADYNFQDAVIRWDIINDEFEGSPKISEYAGQEQNDFYCQEHADEIETSDFYAESDDYSEGVEKGISMGYCEGCGHAYPLDAMNEYGMCEECEGVLIADIDWETDGEDVGLPSSVRVPSDLEEDEIADYLSDKYGFLVNGFVMGAETFEARGKLNPGYTCGGCMKRIETGHNSWEDFHKDNSAKGSQCPGVVKLTRKPNRNPQYAPCLTVLCPSCEGSPCNSWKHYDKEPNVKNVEKWIRNAENFGADYEQDGWVKSTATFRTVCSKCKENEPQQDSRFCKECEKGMGAETLSMKNLGAVAVGGALGIALVGLFTGKNLLTDMTSKLSKASEAKKDCHSCNTNGSVRKNQTQVLSSEYSVGQINPVEVEGQQDVHGAEGVNNPRFAPSPSPAPHRAKSSKWL